MAKCSICMKVKGKRQCLAFNGTVCSSCCGASRDSNKCAGCSFYKNDAELRRYEKVPHYSTEQMADNPELQNAANVIEGALCSFDSAQDQTTSDGFYLKVVERLLDRYSFGDHDFLFSDDLEKKGFLFIESAINEDLAGVTTDHLAKVIGTVYRSIKRRAEGNSGGRQYIDFIRRYVGVRVATGVRALSI